MVFQTKPLRKRGHRGPRSFRQAFDGKHQLVLLRFNAICASGLFADVEKLPDLVSVFGEPSVRRKGYIHVGKNTLKQEYV